MRVLALAAALGGMAGLTACQAPPTRPAGPESRAAPEPASAAVAVIPDPPAPASSAAQPEPLPEISPPPPVVTVQAEEPRYLPPESLKRFRYAKPPAEKPAPAAKPVVADATATSSRTTAGLQASAIAAAPPGATVSNAAPSKSAKSPASQSTRSSGDVPVAPEAAPATSAAGEPVVIARAAELPVTTVARVEAQPEVPRYKRPESLDHWGSGRRVPLYVDPDAAPWQATPTEPRLQNAAVSCTYKDEGGVRGKAMLLVDNHKLTRFTARIEMPNGGVCQFDSKKMAQRPSEQGIALQSNGDECVVRMWEQKHRITVAAYSCHKQCSKGSFSYLWPIIMDTRVGTCY